MPVSPLTIITIIPQADEMLSRGFKDQIYDVFRTLNENIEVGHPVVRKMI
jgi:superfamily II DNA/RNA helicase